MPEGMRFENVIIDNGYGRLQYNYKNSKVLFVQTKSDDKTSMVHSSDAREMNEIWNQGLHMNISIYGEIIAKNRKRYEASFSCNGVYYYLFSEMQQDQFEEMLKKVHF